MCGIFGTQMNPQALKDVIQGLNDLSYRGYDSWGVAFHGEESLCEHKASGRVPESLSIPKLYRQSVIGHTRWSTHGAPTDRNAHPHLCEDRRFAVVHNGIIENHHALRALCSDVSFNSDTDSEVIVHLIADHVKKGENPLEATQSVCALLEGRYAFLLMDQLTDHLIAVSRGSPLVVGSSETGYPYIASDIHAISRHAIAVAHLQVNEIAHCHSDGFDFYSMSDGKPLDKTLSPLSHRIQPVNKEGYAHFMRKEIDEQVRCFQQPETVAIPLILDGLTPTLLKNLNRIVILGCGTSWHAGLVAEYWIEQQLGLPVEVEYASEFRYRAPPLSETDCVVAISQSGETADTNAAIELAKSKGATVVAVCNVPGSTLTRLADATLLTHAGPEIGVASTKAFTTQLALLYQLTLSLGLARGVLTEELALSLQQELQELPSKIESILGQEPEIRELADIIKAKAHALFLGRGLQFPIALEAALKLKEVSYIHAEGYPAAEMKHGPIALIDEQMPVFFIAPRDQSYKKIRANMAEVKARGGQVIAITCRGEDELIDEADHILTLPKTSSDLMPFLTVVAFQLLAYHTAKMRGCDIDKPRNLAKSVTVE